MSRGRFKGGTGGMKLKCANIGVRSLNITNMNLFTRFNKTKEIFPNVTQVLSILLKNQLSVQFRKDKF